MLSKDLYQRHLQVKEANKWLDSNKDKWEHDSYGYLVLKAEEKEFPEVVLDYIKDQNDQYDYVVTEIAKLLA